MCVCVHTTKLAGRLAVVEVQVCGVVGGGWQHWHAAWCRSRHASAVHAREDDGAATRCGQSAICLYMRAWLLKHGTSADSWLARDATLRHATPTSRRPLPERQTHRQQECEASSAPAPPGARKQQPQCPQRE